MQTSGHLPGRAQAPGGGFRIDHPGQGLGQLAHRQERVASENLRQAIGQIAGQAHARTLQKVKGEAKLLGGLVFEPEPYVVRTVLRVAEHGLEEGIGDGWRKNFVKRGRVENLIGIGHHGLLSVRIVGGVFFTAALSGQGRIWDAVSADWGHYNPLGEALMHKRMEDIEIKYIYLQKTVDDLNVVVIEQQKEIRELRAMLTLLGKKLQDVSTMPSFDPDEKPPHY